jgi:Ni,Fe-hydrogenase I small subunit
VHGCTGVRTAHWDPPLAVVIFEVISLDYHVNIMQCAGEAIVEVLEKTIHD